MDVRCWSALPLLLLAESPALASDFSRLIPFFAGISALIMGIFVFAFWLISKFWESRLIVHAIRWVGFGLAIMMISAFFMGPGVDPQAAIWAVSLSLFGWFVTAIVMKPRGDGPSS